MRFDKIYKNKDCMDIIKRNWMNLRWTLYHELNEATNTIVLFKALGITLFIVNAI